MKMMNKILAKILESEMKQEMKNYDIYAIEYIRIAGELGGFLSEA
jgi:hypothetical protein